MGNTLSSFGGQKKVQSIINKSGLPLQIDDSKDDDSKTPLSTFTEAYPAPGWFTGVKSAITIQKPASEVYDSLSKNLHHVFTPMSECDDEIVEDDGAGKQAIFRVVRIPFKVAFVTGNLKLRLNVKQDKQEGKIHFESVKEGRLITRFIADFDIRQSQDRLEETIVRLDSKVNCKSVPPPPFKNMVKDVMVRKMDSCMVDLLNYHNHRADSDVDDDEFESASETSLDERRPIQAEKSLHLQAEKPLQTEKPGFLEMMRSLSAPLRRSLEFFEGHKSAENPRNSELTDSAHDVLGHNPIQAPHKAPQNIPATTSALYQPSANQAPKSPSKVFVAQTEAPENATAMLNEEKTQADVFSTWQEKHILPPATVF